MTPELNQLIEDGAEKKLPFVEIEPSNAVRATNFNNETICARNVFKAGATFITTDLKALALIPEVKALIDVVATYHEYFTAIEHGDYENNRRTKPLRGFEDMMQHQAKRALTPFTDSKIEKVHKAILDLDGTSEVMDTKPFTDSEER